MNIQQQGFTLIEMMITVAIIAILASIALPSYQNYIKKARLQEGQSNLVSLSLAVEATYQRQLAYSTTNTLPNTWANPNANFTYAYTAPTGTPPLYTLTATGASGTIVSGCTITLSQNGDKANSCGPNNKWIE